MKEHRAIFISDIHLGTRGSQAESLVSFLKENDAPDIYLVGDIIDGWRMKRSVYWPESHNQVIHQILKKSKNGSNIFFIVGNHDEFLRNWLRYDLQLGRIKISNHETYISSEGKTYLVIHGDLFDSLMKAELKWLMHLGDVLYIFIIWLNTKMNKLRLFFGMKYWSLSKFLKDRTKRALNYIDSYEKRLCEYAKSKGYDGIICGHIHSPKMEYIDGIEYINDGDWVENCTAVVENNRGEFVLVDYSNGGKNERKRKSS